MEWKFSFLLFAKNGLEFISILRVSTSRSRFMQNGVNLPNLQCRLNIYVYTSSNETHTHESL